MGMRLDLLLSDDHYRSRKLTYKVLRKISEPK